MDIKVLGIDPALRNMGFAHASVNVETMGISLHKLVLAETEANKKTAKVVRKNSDDLERATILHQALHQECIENTFAFAEVPVGSQSSRAMASYGICIGVLASCPIPLIQLTPTEVKLAATGSKNAAKQEMIEWAVAMYPNLNWLTRKLRGETVLLNDNEHLADAVATIHAGVETDQFQHMVALTRKLFA